MVSQVLIDMEQAVSQTTSTPINADIDNLGDNQDYTIIWITLGIIALYWWNKQNQKKNQEFLGAVYNEISNNKIIDSYSKFIKTPLGSRYEGVILRQGVKPSANQVLGIDSLLQRLSREQHIVLKKASQFETRKDVERALTQRELAIYLPIRKKMMERLDNIMSK